MDATLVDERDAQWEVASAGFRVGLYQDGGVVATYDLDTENVEEAFAWATSNAIDSRFQMYAKVQNDRGELGLIRLTPPFVP